MDDDLLIAGMLSDDLWIAAKARALWDKQHANDAPITEPPHCSECFEGCPKCEGKR